MKSPPEPADTNDHAPSPVIRFKPRSSAVEGSTGSDDQTGAYPEDDDADLDRRRNQNIAGFAVAALLIAAGVWLAITMADLRKNQACALTGRPNCGALEQARP